MLALGRTTLWGAKMHGYRPASTIAGGLCHFFDSSSSIADEAGKDKPVYGMCTRLSLRTGMEMRRVAH